MADEQRVSKEVYLRRRLMVGLAAIALAATSFGAILSIAGGSQGPVASDPTVLAPLVDSVAVAESSSDDSAAVGSTPEPLPTAPTTGSSSASTVPAVSGAPAIDAAAYAILDTSTGIWLAGQAADEQRPVGSVMKLLTALVVIEAGDSTKVVTVPTLNMNVNESAIGLYAGEQLSRDVLLRAMLIVSANDAAKTLAIDVGGSESAFVDLMNQTAQRLGLADTVAANPIGLDASGAHSTARDMAILAETLMKDGEFQITVARTSANLHGQVFQATNGLLTRYRGADGIKTGHTTDAGYCLVGSATRGGRRIIVAVLGAPTDEARIAGATTLLDWAFSQP